MSKRDRQQKALEQAAALAATKVSDDKDINTPVSVSFRYVVAGNSYCLSKCSQEQVKHFKDCLRMLTTMTWQQVLQTGGKPYGGKVGLGFTPYDDNSLRKVTRPPEPPASFL